ncbi:MAG: PD-(D/E)XK nuclease family protein [Acidobacteria bacterium]|nr:PD-(D/E)XK nuclease family protein [Acidobacteriota bacterium]
MKEILEQLADACRRFPADEKALVTPSFAAGRHITDALARSGSSWINLHVHTIDSLAASIAGGRLARKRIALASRAQRLALVEQACLEVLPPDGYFGALRAQPGFHRAMDATLADLRRGGVTASRMKKAGSGAKPTEIAEVLARYSEILRRHRLGDRADLLLEAVAALKEKDPGVPFFVLVAALEGARGLDRELLDSLPRVEHLAVREGVSASSVSFSRGLGIDHELRSILRRHAAEGRPLDQIEIVLTDPVRHSAIAHEVFAEFDLTATFETGLPVIYSRPGRAVSGFLEWVRRDWDAVWLRRLVATGVIELGSGVGYRRAARMIRDAGIGWGRDRYAPQLNALVRRAEYRASRNGRRTEAERDAARAVREVVLDGMIAHTPDAGIDDRFSTSALARLTAAFARTRLRVASERDGAAREAILLVLDELTGLPSDDSISLSEACLRLEGVLADVRVGASSAMPGLPHVSSVATGGLTGRPSLCIVGAADSIFPGSGAQDPILLDDERSSLNRRTTRSPLELRGSRPERREREMVELLNRFEGDLHVSWSPEDVLGGQPDLAAGFVLDLFRESRSKPGATREELDCEAGEPTGFVPAAGEAPLSETEWWLGEWNRSAPLPARWLAKSLGEARPLIEARERARVARASSELTSWDGKLDVPEGELDPRETGEVMSSSRIERLATCPFSYFLRYVLGVHPVEEVVRDGTRWLDPRERGLMLHEIFRELMAGAEGKLSPERDRVRAREIAEKGLAEWRRRIPPPNVETYELEREDVLRACEVLLEVEAQAPPELTPFAFEVAFGREIAGEPGRLESPDPVVIEVKGRSFNLRGQIDRIDQIGPGEFAVLDYKTGSAYAFDDISWTRGGRQLQHVLYARAVDELLRRGGVAGTVREAGYYFPTRKGLGRKFMKSVHARDSRVDDLLSDLLDVARHGSFVHSGDIDEDCRFCDFRAACFSDEARTFAGQVEEKIKSPDPDSGIEAWLRARGVE